MPKSQRSVDLSQQLAKIVGVGIFLMRGYRTTPCIGEALLAHIGTGVTLIGIVGDVQWSARTAYPTHLGGMITNTTGRGVWRA
jgi:hypothetical protein